MSRLGSVVVDVEAERIGERITAEGREARYRLCVPGALSKQLDELRECAENAAISLARMAGDVFYASDTCLEDFGLRGDRRVVELDMLWAGTPGSHYGAYELTLVSVPNHWGV